MFTKISLISLLILEVSTLKVSISVELLVIVLMAIVISCEAADCSLTEVTISFISKAFLSVNSEICVILTSASLESLSPSSTFVFTPSPLSFTFSTLF